jgi:glucose-6-phosphate isomerase
MSALTSSPEWQALAEYRRKTENLHISDLFREDRERFQKFSITLPGFLFDYSKNLLTGETIRLLLDLAGARGLQQQINDLFSGALVNATEKRSVLHTALRGENIAPPEKIKNFADDIRAGVWRGYSGREITDIVNIGIGGSCLGPQLVTEALKFFHHPRLKAHFVSNVEASDLAETLKALSPETTLFIISSKTFTTAETLQNAARARSWLLEKAGSGALEKHFVAVTSNQEAAKNFGIPLQNIFPVSDGVGGRHSVWSATGLPVMLMVGAEAFSTFLDGARAMDHHFQTAPFEKNIPVLMGMTGIWYRNFLNYPAYACVPYHTALRRLPAWLQQLDMESNGKYVDKNGQPVGYATGPIVFGEPGTDAQHSFFQWLHQSPTPVAVDLIGAINTPYGSADQQNILLAHLLAQGAALMKGQESGEPHRLLPGNRPSNTILLDEISPHTIGMLLALYEHKIFVQGAVWNINSFDQWGVELGKLMAKDLEKKSGTQDPSTEGLMQHISRVKD